jgi:uncharacterized integral membrane protein (TIGR00697 family)
MSLLVIVLWVIGITAFTLLGSWYARRFNKPDLLIGLYVAFILLAQILAVKIAAFNLGFHIFTAPAGVLVFSVTYLFTDIVNEKFGQQETHKMIFIGFLAQVAMVVFLWLGTALTPAGFWTQQSTWAQFFGLVPRITAASWVAFLISENADAVVYAWFKRLTKGRHLWFRNAFTSIPALLLDSVIFITLAFAGILPIVPLIIGQVAVKWLVGLINVPFMYLNKWVMGKAG